MVSTNNLPVALPRLIIEAAEQSSARFPQTEIFNEGWMLRLVLDAFLKLGVTGHPMSFEEGADWFSEVRLSSRFRPRSRQDNLAEGFTHADAVLGHFNFREDTAAGLSLPAECRQFVVLEAKMFSNLSKGVKNAPDFNQAARNVACMAEAIEQSPVELDEIKSVGFFVVAPPLRLRASRRTNLEDLTHPETVRVAVAKRIEAYEMDAEADASKMHLWREKTFEPLVSRMEKEGTLAVLSWDDLTERIRELDDALGEELWRFYQRCLSANQGLSF